MSVLTRRHFLKQAGVVSLSFLFGPSVWAKGKDFPIRCGIDMGLQHLFVIPQVMKMMEAKGYTNMQWKKLATKIKLQSFATKALDIMGEQAPGVGTFYQRDKDIKVIGALAWAKEGALLVASKKSGIKCLGDLKGKRLALKSLAGGSAVFYLGFAKKLYGVDLRRDVKVYETENPAGALMNGLVDACIAWGPGYKKLMATGQCVRITSLGEEWKKYSGSNRLLVYGPWIAQGDFVRKHPEAIKDFLDCQYEAFKFYKQHPDEANRMVMEYGNVPKSVAEFVADYLGLNDVEPERVYFSEKDKEDYHKLFTMFRDVGYIKEVPDDSVYLITCR